MQDQRHQHSHQRRCLELRVNATASAALSDGTEASDASTEAPTITTDAFAGLLWWHDLTDAAVSPLVPTPLAMALLASESLLCASGDTISLLLGDAVALTINV